MALRGLTRPRLGAEPLRGRGPRGAWPETGAEPVRGTGPVRGQSLVGAEPTRDEARWGRSPIWAEPVSVGFNGGGASEAGPNGAGLETGAEPVRGEESVMGEAERARS